MTDQSLLADIAKNDGENKVRLTAVGRITDQSMLVHSAKKDPKSLMYTNLGSFDAAKAAL